MKLLFVILSIVGVAIISVLSFILPSNPNEIIPSFTAMRGDMPLWSIYLIGFSFIYLLILWAIYDKIMQKKSKIKEERSI